MEQLIGEELGRSASSTATRVRRGQFDEAVALFKEVALADDYADFLTIPAYERMP